MIPLVLGLGLFLGIHSVALVAPGARQEAIAKLGLGGWKGLYSLVAAVGLALIVWGFVQARQQPVLAWVPPVGLRHASLLLLVPVFPLLLAAYLPGRIRSAAGGHPMLAATALWGFAHLLANGMVAEILLFGGFLVWAVADRVSLVRRVQDPMPLPPPSVWNDVGAVVGGLLLYGVTLAGAHRWLFGVAPIPSLNLF